MGAFEYVAVDQAGKETKGLIEGDTAKHVRQILRDRHMLPVQVTEVAEVYTPAVEGGVVRAMEDIQLSGYVETMFTVATAQPGTGYYNDIGGNRAGINELRSFDRLNNSFTLNQLKLTLQKQAPETGGIGFRGDIIFGEDAKWLNRVTHQTGPMRLIYQR